MASLNPPPSSSNIPSLTDIYPSTNPPDRKRRLRDVDFTSEIPGQQPRVWPRFLIIQSASADHNICKISPFLIFQSLKSLSGEPKSVKKLRNGTLLVELTREIHSELLLKADMLANIPIKVNAHQSLNFSKGVIRHSDLDGSSESEMQENLASQGVTKVDRISVHRDGKLIPTNTYIPTFNCPNLPNYIKAGYINIKVTPYIPNPLRCFNCQLFGHSRNVCKNTPKCARCGHRDHDSTTCQKDPCCVNCKGSHVSYSRECPKFISEKNIQKIKTEKKISYPEARKLVENSTPLTASGKSFANAVKSQSSSIGCQTNLTWPLNTSSPKLLPVPSTTVSSKPKMVTSSTQTSEAPVLSTCVVEETDTVLPEETDTVLLAKTDESTDNKDNKKASKPSVKPKPDLKGKGITTPNKEQLSAALSQAIKSRVGARTKKGERDPILLYNKFGDVGDMEVDDLVYDPDKKRRHSPIKPP